MYPLRHTVRATAQVQRCYISDPASRSTTFTRHIRIRSSSDTEAEKRPSEGHVLERKEQPKNTLDPQAQSAQGSSRAPHQERPSYVHAEANKGNVMGGASKGGKEEPAAPSLWSKFKKMLGSG